MTKRHRARGLTVVALTALALAACASGATSNSTSDGYSGVEPINFTVTTYDGWRYEYSLKSIQAIGFGTEPGSNGDARLTMVGVGDTVLGMEVTQRPSGEVSPRETTGTVFYLWPGAEVVTRFELSAQQREYLETYGEGRDEFSPFQEFTARMPKGFDDVTQLNCGPKASATGMMCVSEGSDLVRDDPQNRMPKIVSEFPVPVSGFAPDPIASNWATNLAEKNVESVVVQEGWGSCLVAVEPIAWRATEASCEVDGNTIEVEGLAKDGMAEQ